MIGLNPGYLLKSLIINLLSLESVWSTLGPSIPKSVRICPSVLLKWKLEPPSIQPQRLFWKSHSVITGALGAKYLGVFSSCSLKMREKYISFAQFVYFLMEVFYFSILNDKIHNYMCQKKLIVNFIIQKLKSKHTSIKKYTNWAKLIQFFLNLREQEEKKTPNISRLNFFNHEFPIWFMNLFIFLSPVISSF